MTLGTDLERDRLAQRARRIRAAVAELRSCVDMQKVSSLTLTRANDASSKRSLSLKPRSRPWTVAWLTSPMRRRSVVSRATYDAMGRCRERAGLGERRVALTSR
jgi:hypothetical protein